MGALKLRACCHAPIEILDPHYSVSRAGMVSAVGAADLFPCLRSLTHPVAQAGPGNLDGRSVKPAQKKENAMFESGMHKHPCAK